MQREKIVALLASCAVLTASCGLPSTPSDCHDVVDSGALVDCWNEVTFHGALRGAAIGAVAGAALGGVIGGLSGGPHRAVTGALAGAGLGAATGAILSYREAVAAVTAHNRHLRGLVNAHAVRDAESQQTIENLERQLRIENVQRSNLQTLVTNLRSEQEKTKQEGFGLKEEIRILQSQHAELRGRGDSGGYELKMQLNALTTEVEQLREFQRKAFARDDRLKKLEELYRYYGSRDKIDQPGRLF